MDREIKAASWWEITLLALTYGLPIAFFTVSLFTTDGQWFSRSGSLMVMLGAFLEWKNFGAQQYLREKRDATWKPEEEYIVELKKRKIFDIFILASLLIGTTIWGYGDLLFNLIKFK